MLIQPLTPEILEKRRNFRRKILGSPIGIWRKTGRVWRKTRRGIGWTLAAFFVAHCALNIYASILLNRELSAIRQKGQPLQFVEMAPPAVPDAQNAALVYKQAFDSLRLSSDERLIFDPRKANYNPQVKRDIEAALAKNQKTLDLVRRAAMMPQCRFPLDYAIATPTALLFPYYSEMRELARLMAAQANLEAQNGDKAAALRDARALFNMAHHLSNEPVLIGFLVAQAVDGIAHKALAQVLEIVPLNVSEARSFEASLPQSDWNRAFRRTLMGERSWGVPFLETLGPLTMANMLSNLNGDESPSVWRNYPLFLIWRPFMKLDEVQMLRLWKLVIDSPAHQQVPRPVGLSESLDTSIENTPRYALLTRILFPVFSRAGDNRDRAEVRKRQRKVALALTAYRTARGRYPARLSETGSLWKEPLPLDIYSNKPFIYRHDEKGFLLYSIGADRTDNGGKNRLYGYVSSKGWRKGWKPDDDDILWGAPRN